DVQQNVDDVKRHRGRAVDPPLERERQQQDRPVRRAGAARPSEVLSREDVSHPAGGTDPKVVADDRLVVVGEVARQTVGITEDARAGEQQRPRGTQARRAHRIWYSSLRMRHPVGVIASPPSAVSLSDRGIASPIFTIASTTSSIGMTLSTPARAVCAPVRASIAVNPLRTTQGTSTSPATGSQARPSVFWSVSAAACTDILGVPPSRNASAPAAIAAPTPCSA